LGPDPSRQNGHQTNRWRRPARCARGIAMITITIAAKVSHMPPGYPGLTASNLAPERPLGHLLRRRYAASRNGEHTTKTERRDMPWEEIKPRNFPALDKDLDGISKQTMEDHFKLYEGYIKKTTSAARSSTSSSTRRSRATRSTRICARSRSTTRSRCS